MFTCVPQRSGSRLTNQQRLATCFLGRYPLAGINQSDSPNGVLLGYDHIQWRTNKGEKRDSLLLMAMQSYTSKLIHAYKAIISRHSHYFILRLLNGFGFLRESEVQYAM